MKKNLFLLSVFLFLSFISCKEDNLVEDINGDTLINESIPLRSLGDGQFDVLGHGYDITGKYLDGSSTRALVIDVTSLNNQNLITFGNFNETTFSHSSGTDIVKFSNDMSAEIGLSSPAFSGSLNFNFKSSYKFDSKKSYAFYSLEYLKKRYVISASTQDIKANLTTNFKNHLNSMSPAQIVEVYGTHILKSVYVGARLEAYLETEATTSEKEEAVNAKLAYTYKQLFKTDVNYSYNESLVNKTRNSKFFYKTVGGTFELESGEFMDVDGTNIKSPKLDMVKWSQSIQNDTPRFIKVEPNTLIPIYELIDNPSKRSAVESYVKKYIDDAKPESVNNYSPSGGVRNIPLTLSENQGCGVAIADINRNGIPDLILMAVDNPAKDNYYYYKILFDIDEFGNSNRYSAEMRLGKVDSYENQGGSIAVTDLNNNGIPDIIFAAADYPKNIANPLFYKVAFDVDLTGKPKYISGGKSLPAMGHDYQGVGIDVYDFNKNGKPDVIYMAYDNPKGRNTFRYRIAYDFDADGIPKGGVSGQYDIDGIGNEGQGAGVAVADINGNGIPDILFTALDNPNGENKFQYKILWDVNSAGYSYISPTHVAPTFTGMNIGHEHQGGDCAIYDINNDGKLDIVLTAIDNPKGTNAWVYMTGFGFTNSGLIQYWR